MSGPFCSEGVVFAGMNYSTEIQTNDSDLNSVFTLRVLPSLYCLVFVVGLPLNCMVAWIFLRLGADSGLVVYLQNMVVADLLMLITIPLRVADNLGFQNKDLYVITCRYTDVLFYTCLYMGIIFIGFISLERYAKIVHPSSSASCTPRFSVVSLLRYLEKTRCAWVVVLLSWVILLAIVLPNVVMTSKDPTGKNFQDCMLLKTPAGAQWHTGIIVFNTILFWVTFVIVTFCYGSIGVEVYRSQTRICQDSTGACGRSSRSIFIILVVFFICFVPYHACRIQYTHCQVQESKDCCRDSVVLYHLKEVTLFLSALNVCLNPVIYFFMCPKFQETLKRKLSERRRRRSQTVHPAQTLSNT